MSQTLEQRKAYSRARWANNSEKLKLKARQYRAANKEKMRMQDRAKYKKYKDKIKNRVKRWVKENPDKAGANKLRWLVNNKEKRKEVCRNYYKRHRPRIQEAFNARRRLDPIRSRLGSRLRGILKLNKAPKSYVTAHFVGCSWSELRAHLASTFTGGMSWERLSELHIDHIIPCCSFDLTKPDQQRACFHYSNLRMLWAIDNLKKSAVDRRYAINKVGK